VSLLREAFPHISPPCACRALDCCSEFEVTGSDFPQVGTAPQRPTRRESNRLALPTGQRRASRGAHVERGAPRNCSTELRVTGSESPRGRNRALGDGWKIQ